jgi:transcriptional regulator
VIHDDPEWISRQVRRLTGMHEAEFDHPWSVDDAPGRFIAGQLRAIVGVELVITRIEAKAKLSQNRPDGDIDGVVAGLAARGQSEAAADVERSRPDRNA